jgi:membrane-associated phospholipid phosphatase
MNLLDLDQSLFYAINSIRLPLLLEELCILARRGSTWIPLYALLAVWLLYRFKMKGLWIALIAAACAGFTDYTNSKILKTAIQRSRPCQILPESTIQLRVSCGTGKSFPSSHAANHMAFALFLIHIFGKRFRWVLLLFPWALCIGFCQIFVGVHYPIDILAGFIYGGITSFLFYKLSQRMIGEYST